MKMLIASEWREGEKRIEVRNPYDNNLIDTIPDANGNDVDEAITSALKGYEETKRLSAYERSKIREMTKKVEIKKEKYE